VVAQQRDEAAPAFTQRVRRRVQRLRKEAEIDSVDVYAGPSADRLSTTARWEVVGELGAQMAAGSRLTLWSRSDDQRTDAELAAILAQFSQILAERQIAVNHQTCETEERSGVRHAVPTRPIGSDSEFEIA